MERVAFLIEETGQRLSSMLNPESLVVERLAGVEPRRTAGGTVTGAGLWDHPLLLTGGGSTVLRMDLLFDVALSGSTIESEDVRQLTAPLWNLAENVSRKTAYGHPPLVRFVWGKTWNIPGLIVAVAERLEQFTADGTPRRSWMSLKMRRVVEPVPREDAAAAAGKPALAMSPDAIPDESVRAHSVVGGGSREGTSSSERLDNVADRYFGDPRYWRILAEFNGIDDPSRMNAGEAVRVPPATAVKREAP